MARMLSLILAGLTVLTLLSLLWPLARAERARGRAASAIDHYRALVAEIERDAARGLVPATDAEGAKAEAARRLLAMADQSSGTTAPAPRWAGWVAALAVVLLVPAISIGLYTFLGAPELPDQPLAARLAARPATTDVAAAIAKIETHLKAHPDDARGWEVVAPVYLRMGRAHEAALAYAAVLRLRGATPALRASYGEALVYAAQGSVTEEARRAFAQALAEDPSLVKARFFTGLAAEQDGDVAKAAALWGKIAAEEPDGSPLAEALRERLAGLGAPLPPTGGAAAIAALPEAERATAIRGMVARLAVRLTENGSDVEGWLKLVRAYAVLNEREKALAAVAEARHKLSSDAAATARIDALVRELGLDAKDAS
jgi:cytochrome c-type biogenesis protein CcmH